MDNHVAKPFVKWAGGKRQLLPIINENLPKELKEREINKYIEPFVGGGAVLFDIISRYEFEQIIINDCNKDLMNVYKHIKNYKDDIIDELQKLSDDYLSLNDDNRKNYYYKARDLFNIEESGTIMKSALFIFLNRTCFNGLYRVNSSGKFNVPHGSYKNPTILDIDNILKVSEALSKVTILNGDFTIVEEYVDEKTFVYLDPPYRPLSATSNFTSYANNDFNDDEQIRLANFYKYLHNEKRAKLMLSNSDPKNTNENDNFFDELYKQGNDFTIKRVKAKRAINSKGNGRGKITELLIINY